MAGGLAEAVVAAVLDVDELRWAAAVPRPSAGLGFGDPDEHAASTAAARTDATGPRRPGRVMTDAVITASHG
ncbi:hypothetical protein GCM10027053_53860 [Intrasporangium mesophilum]